MEQTPKPPHRPAGIPASMRQGTPQPRPATPPRPVAPAHPAPAPQRVSAPKPPTPPKPKKSFTFAAIGIGVVSVIIVVAAMVMGLTKLMAAGEVKSGSDQYQAVFLSNNMVYFGKVSNVGGEYIKMTDIFYLQVNQQSDQKDAKAQVNTNQASQLSLAKLGNELHGPEDAMYINRKEVLFWENLKPDGKVVQAIKNYKSGK